MAVPTRESSRKIRLLVPTKRQEVSRTSSRSFTDGRRKVPASWRFDPTEPKVGAPEGKRGPVRRIVVTDCSTKVDSARRKLHPSTRPHLISTCPAPRRATWRLGQKMADEPFQVDVRKAPSLRPSRVVIYASHTASNGYHSLSESRAIRLPVTGARGRRRRPWHVGPGGAGGDVELRPNWAGNTLFIPRGYPLDRGTGRRGR